MADLVKCNLAVTLAKTAADVAMFYPATMDVNEMVIGAAVDAGHANGPENDEKDRYKSCGGQVLMLASANILEDRPAPIAILGWKSGLARRACRSTLAAEASNLAEAVEAVDWVSVFVQEVLRPKIDLKAWPGRVWRAPRHASTRPTRGQSTTTKPKRAPR